MSNRKTTLFYAVLIAVASTAIGMVLASRLDLSPESSAQTMSAPAMNGAPVTGAVDAQTFRNIAKAQIPIVVNISTEQRRRTQELTEFFGGDDMLRRFFGDPQQQPNRPREDVTEGAGTGFVIDKTGIILTNNHVVEGATRIRVGFFGDDEGRYYEAKTLGRDPLTDSALIELVEKPSRELAVAKFGDSDQMEPGDWVMAIGNPFNLGHTVTVGVVSAIGRPFFPVPNREQAMIQTDAAINPGNSGGPLLNLRGEVVGINTAILSDRSQAGNLGIGFAVPINAVRELLPQLRSGKVTRGRIGVSLSRQVPDEVFEELGVKNGEGALISQVEPNGPAAKGGIQPGDVIVEFNGQAVKGNDELVERVVRTMPGSSVPVKILRDKQSRTLNVTVQELDLEAESRVAENAPAGDVTAGFGMTLQDLTPDVARQLNTPSGTGGAVIVDLEPRGAGARAGLRPRDVITEVNGTSVNSAAEASRALQRVESGRIARLLVLRGGQGIFLTVRKD
ncbi:MAG: Do family serine endopeptidase [Vicinamibacterales bacterium]